MTSIAGNDDDKRVNVLMIGTGEYTTGFVGGGKADSDKGAGVVGIVMFDLRRRGKVGKLGLVGTNGKKMPQIHQHMENNIGKVYKDMDLTCSTFPADGTVDREAYLKALDQFLARRCCHYFHARQYPLQDCIGSNRKRTARSRDQATS